MWCVWVFVLQYILFMMMIKHKKISQNKTQYNNACQFPSDILLLIDQTRLSDNDDCVCVPLSLEHSVPVYQFATSSSNYLQYEYTSVHHLTHYNTHTHLLVQTYKQAHANMHRQVHPHSHTLSKLCPVMC